MRIHNVLDMDTTINTTATRSDFVRTAGRLCLAGAIIGVIGGLVTAFISPAVAPDRYSYPYSPTGYVLAELTFILNHVLLLVGVLGVARAGAAGRGRLGRVGLWTSAVGLMALTLCEVGSAALANSAIPTPRTDALGAGYGVASILTGVGLILAGVAVVRTRHWTGWARYIVLICGIAVFVIVIPGIASTFLAGRLVLVAWMLMFATLGLALIRAPRPATTR
jgi:hypothetical protein